MRKNRGETEWGIRAAGLAKGIALALVLVCAVVIMMCAGGGRQGAHQAKKVLSAMNGEPVVPREANRLLIEEFSGAEGDTALRRKLYLRVRDHIAGDGRLGIVEAGDEHDLVLRGRLKLYEVRPVRFNDLGLPVIKRIRMVAAVSLGDPGRNKVIFNDPDMQSFEEFSDIVQPVSSELAVQDSVVDGLAKRIARKVVSGWYTELMTPAEKGQR